MDKITTRSVPVVQMKLNERAIILGIETDDVSKVRKLAAFGIMPDSDIMLLQKYPAYIIQVGFTQVALDWDIASRIMVLEKPGVCSGRY